MMCWRWAPPAMLLLVFGFVTPSMARPWRTIEPLVTTRSEVIRLLGVPKHNVTTAEEYFDLSAETVTIEWIRHGRPMKEPIQAGEALYDDDLVRSITVRPKSPLRELNDPEDVARRERVAQAKDHKTALRMIFEDAEFLSCLIGDGGTWSCTHIQSKEGFAYMDNKEGIHTLTYFPGEEEAARWNRENGTSPANL